jgi:hypothetical protein
MLSIAEVTVDPMGHDSCINIWVSVEAHNSTSVPKTGLLTVVVESASARETLEMTEELEPGANFVDVVVRIDDMDEWAAADADNAEYTCIVGLRCEGEVQSVYEKRFTVSPRECLGS